MKEKAFNSVFYTPADKCNNNITSPFYMLTFSASYFNLFCNGLSWSTGLDSTPLPWKVTVTWKTSDINQKKMDYYSHYLSHKLRDKDSKYFAHQDDIQIKGCVKQWTRL